MLQFKCIYCGQGLTAQEDERGQKGRCPKCNHDYFVPKATTATPPIRVEKTETIRNAKEPLTETNPIFNKKHDSYKFDEVKVDTYKLSPTYDELSLFLMAFTLIILLIANTTMQEQAYKLTMGIYNYIANFKIANYSLYSKDNDLVGLLCLVAAVAFFLGGFGFSIYHIYTTREKTTIERNMMLYFAVLTNIFTSVTTGIYIIKNTTGWLIIFPICNLINAGWLLMMVFLEGDKASIRCISDRKATSHQIIIGLTVIFLIFIFCNFVFELYWVITFSICIIYTTSFDRALQNVLPGLTYGGDEQTS